MTETSYNINWYTYGITGLPINLLFKCLFSSDLQEISLKFSKVTNFFKYDISNEQSKALSKLDRKQYTLYEGKLEFNYLK